jgi:hypothetical protein
MKFNETDLKIKSLNKVGSIEQMTESVFYSIKYYMHVLCHLL